MLNITVMTIDFTEDENECYIINKSRIALVRRRRL